MSLEDRFQFRKSIFLERAKSIQLDCDRYLSSSFLDWLFLRDIYYGFHALKRLIEEIIFIKAPRPRGQCGNAILIGRASEPVKTTSVDNIFLDKEIDCIIQFYRRLTFYYFYLCHWSTYPEETEEFYLKTQILVVYMEEFLEIYSNEPSPLFASNAANQVIEINSLDDSRFIQE